MIYMCLTFYVETYTIRFLCSEKYDHVDDKNEVNGTNNKTNRFSSTTHLNRLKMAFLAFYGLIKILVALFPYKNE